MTGTPSEERSNEKRRAERSAGASEADRAVRVTVPESVVDVVGAVLMDLMGPFEVETPQTVKAPQTQDASQTDDAVRTEDARLIDDVPRTDDIPACSSAGASVRMTPLRFFPEAGAEPATEEILAALPEGLVDPGLVLVETVVVARDWVEGWRDHFHPIVVGKVRIRPPWESPPDTPVAGEGGPSPGAAGAAAAQGRAGTRASLRDVVINPGLGFGTGLHPTTRGTLQLLQVERSRGARGPLVDAGTGSGILAIAAAKLGWHPVLAFDKDAAALVSARENVEANGVDKVVEVHKTDVSNAPLQWFAGSTVLANMTLGPVSSLVRKLRDTPVSRLVVSGILAGTQECELLNEAEECGFSPGRRLYEAEWVSLELVPTVTGEPVNFMGS